MPRSEALKEAQRRYQENHPTTINALNMKYRSKHHEDYLEFQQAYYYWRKYLDNTKYRTERKLYLECLIPDM